MTHHVDHAGAALWSCEEILNSAAKFVSVKDEGPSLLNRQLASITMWFKFPMLVEIHGDPLPISLSPLLDTTNSILANCNPRPEKAHDLLGRVAYGPLGDPLLSGGGRPSHGNVLPLESGSVRRRPRPRYRHHHRQFDRS
jgi:hypothetical protein